MLDKEDWKEIGFFAMLGLVAIGVFAVVTPIAVFIMFKMSHWLFR